MKNSRYFAICGAVLLGLMLLVATFSLGVYVGRYGLTREGLVYAGPGAQPMGGGGAGQQPPGSQLRSPGGPGQAQPGVAPLPPGLNSPPQLIGHIIGLSPEAIDLATPNGPRSALLTSETVVEDYEGNTRSLQELTRDQAVGVYGEFSGNGGRVLTATRIVILPPSP